ncbi:hypothetical protein ZIOFF_031797 [Zingiber officinale]|uniref:Uncharacterized protein n=1 Tax=Zingiber officinale TaxID=94328 RepID=A0A8J5GFA2_ZINOF|nr:hypothetical protein ZIOFF_031797 [Zingiber officinale]
MVWLASYGRLVEIFSVTRSASPVRSLGRHLHGCAPGIVCSASIHTIDILLITWSLSLRLCARHQPLDVYPDILLIAWSASYGRLDDIFSITYSVTRPARYPMWCSVDYHFTRWAFCRPLGITFCRSLGIVLVVDLPLPSLVSEDAISSLGFTRPPPSWTEAEASTLAAATGEIRWQRSPLAISSASSYPRHDRLLLSPTRMPSRGGCLLSPSPLLSPAETSGHCRCPTSHNRSLSSLLPWLQSPPAAFTTSSHGHSRRWHLASPPPVASGVSHHHGRFQRLWVSPLPPLAASVTLWTAAIWRAQIWGNGGIDPCCKFLTDLEVVKQFRGDRFGAFRMAIHLEFPDRFEVFKDGFSLCFYVLWTVKIQDRFEGIGMVDYTGCVWGHHIMGAGEEDATLSRGPYLFPQVPINWGDRSMEDGRIFLDTTRAELPVWLLKCPPALSRAFQSVASNSSAATSPVVAKIIHTVDLLHLDDPSSEQFTLEMIQTDPNTPRSYKLNMSKDFAPMCVFSKSNQGKISVEGKVECKFDMEPQNLMAYSNLCRDRTNKAAAETRKVKVDTFYFIFYSTFENDHGMFMRPMPGIVVGQLPSSSKEKRKLTQSKRPNAKRVRKDKGEMLNILFKLFERQPNWGLKQLVLETDQPQV